MFIHITNVNKLVIKYYYFKPHKKEFFEFQETMIVPRSVR